MKVGKKNTELLIKKEYIIKKNDKILIPFLEEQKNELTELQRKRSDAGKKGREKQLRQSPGKGESKPGHLDKEGEGEEEVDKKRKEKNKKDFIDKIVDLFKTNYELIFNEPYEIVNKGKERNCAGKILSIYKKKYPDADSEETLSALNAYFNVCCRIDDNWLSQNMSLSIIVSKFNEINKIIKNGKQGRGAKPGELANLLVDKMF